jgi:tetratricopeptide (TPR) repeat protein
LSDSIREFENAKILDPENAAVYNNLAVVYRKKGQLKKAREIMKEAFGRAPDRADIAYNLGNFYKAEGQTALAEANYRKAIELDPQFIQIGRAHV